MHCIICGINLEPDFNDEDGMVCAQCKAQTKGRVDCEFFEIIDLDEHTNTVIHAVCSMPSPCWPNCNRCLKKMEYADMAAEVQEAEMLGTYKPISLMSSAITDLWQSDVNVLNNNALFRVRIDDTEDAEVKRLYHIYKSL